MAIDSTIGTNTQEYEEEPWHGKKLYRTSRSDQADIYSVLDLPQLYQQPSPDALLSALADLSLQPPSWDPVTRHTKTRKVRNEGVPSYLTKIIASPLKWVDSDEDRELIWEAASQRLSERSGRTGMGAIERAFSIPLHSGDTGVVFDSATIKIHEPALTGDNLGLKTWASSYLLAKRLASFKHHGLPELDASEQILELGSGTGLVGLAAAVVLQRCVLLTDLPDIVPNLERNINENAAVLAEKARSAVLDWSQPSSLLLSTQPHPTHSFRLILAADPIYSPSHPALFTQAVDAHLSRHRAARLVIELPLREGYIAERRDLVARLQALGLRKVAEGEEVGYDDWSAGGRDGEELDEVRCWWSVWGWSEGEVVVC